MPAKTITIPEYGEFTIRTFPAAMRLRFYEIVNSNGRAPSESLSLEQSFQMQCAAVLYGAVDANGRRIYKSIEEIEDLDHPLFDELSTEILRHNGMSVSAVDDAVKNSEPSPPDSSRID